MKKTPNYEDGVEAYKRGDYAGAVRIWMPLAEQGDVDAQFVLGLAYSGGRGVPQNDKESVNWLRKAAEQGHAQAQYNLGFAFHKGEGVPQDDEEAVKWARKAAEQGHAQAQCNLGVAYYNGEGVPQNFEEAVKWWREAAEQGHAQAQYNLGIAYRNSEGVPRDDEEALKWVRKAAEQGHAQAQYNLGLAYHNGEGVPQDDEKAVKWIRKVAEQGYARAWDALEALQNADKEASQGYDRKTKNIPSISDSSPTKEALRESVDCLEFALRKLIAETLRRDFSAVPSHIQDNVKRRIDREIRRDPSYKKRGEKFEGKIEHCYIMELSEIILAAANWEKFESRFGDKEELKRHFLDFNSLRNVISHNKMLGQITVLHGQAAILWLRHHLE